CAAARHGRSPARPEARSHSRDRRPRGRRRQPGLSHADCQGRAGPRPRPRAGAPGDAAGPVRLRELLMKIRLRERAKFQADKMAKIALAQTPRVLLDLYALEPGQSQKVHTHDDQDKIYVVWRAAGASPSAPRTRRW